MNAMDYWQLFLETGAPEVYLMYSKMMESEARHVFDAQRRGPESNGLQ